MKNFIKNLIKNNKNVYILYYFFMSNIIKFLGLFVKVNPNLILFVVYGGKRFDDSPKEVYKYIKNNKNYSKYKCVWAFIEPEKVSEIDDSEKIKIDTLKYYIIALKSKYWITNSSVQRGLDFKKKQTVNILYQHGMAGIKKLGDNIDKENKSFKIKKREEFDKIFIEGKKEISILEEAWKIPKEKLYTTGLPRNDELINVNSEKINLLKKKIGIPINKKVILYAPTFREFYLDKTYNNIIKNPFNFENLKNELEGEYVFLVTAHYQVSKLLDIPINSQFVINAFEYPHINDLMIVSDILISDYSSIVFDYSILERPILCFGYDYNEYIEKRGTYINLEELFYDGVIKTQKQLVDVIKNLDYKKESEHSKRIKEEYIANYGNATQKSVEKIFLKEGE